MIEFILNGKLVKTDDEPDTPLLWVIRDTFKLTGSKFGCGIAQCGACTMHIDGGAQQTCILPIAAVATAAMGKIQVCWAPPSMCMVQAPHWAMPQPNFEPVNLKVSLITQSNGVSGSSSVLTNFPLRINSIMPAS